MEAKRKPNLKPIGNRKILINICEIILIMKITETNNLFYETATVKAYKSKTGKYEYKKKVINLKANSGFNDLDEVAIIKIADFKDLTARPGMEEPTAEKDKEIKKLLDDKDKLSQEIQRLNTELLELMESQANRLTMIKSLETENEFLLKINQHNIDMMTTETPDIIDNSLKSLLDRVNEDKDKRSLLNRLRNQDFNTEYADIKEQANKLIIAKLENDKKLLE